MEEEEEEETSPLQSTLDWKPKESVLLYFVSRLLYGFKIVGSQCVSPVLLNSLSLFEDIIVGLVERFGLFTVNFFKVYVCVLYVRESRSVCLCSCIKKICKLCK